MLHFDSFFFLFAVHQIFYDAECVALDDKIDFCVADNERFYLLNQPEKE